MTWYGMTMTEAKYASEVIFTKDTPYLALTGELWGVFCEDWGENWPRYNGTALYYYCYCRVLCWMCPMARGLQTHWMQHTYPPTLTSIPCCVSWLHAVWCKPPTSVVGWWVRTSTDITVSLALFIHISPLPSEGEYPAVSFGSVRCHPFHFNGLVQERRNSSALAIELCFSCINPLIYYTPAQRSWRGVYWIHLVRLSIRLSVRLSVDDMVSGAQVKVALEFQFQISYECWWWP